MAGARLRAKLITAVLSPLVCLGLLEGVLRIAGYRYLPGETARAEENRRLPRNLYTRRPRLLWTLPPGRVVDVPDAGFPHVQANELGLRGKEVPRYRSAGEFRVLCLGDSVTFGLGIPDGETWPEHLEGILASRPELAGRSVFVLNGGIPGWSSVQGMRLLDQLEWFEPDVIIFWFGMNDVHAAWGRPDAEKGMETRIVDEVAAKLSVLRTVQLLAGITDAIRSPPGGATRASVEDYAAAVGRLEAIEAGGGARVVFVRTPERLATTVSQYEAMVARAEEEGVKWLSGPDALMITLTPAPEETDLVGRVVTGPRGPELRFGGVAQIRWSLERVKKDLADMQGWQRGLAARYALLPEDAMGIRDLLDDAPPATVFLDNCHLNVRGCRLAAQSLAARIIARLPR